MTNFAARAPTLSADAEMIPLMLRTVEMSIAVKPSSHLAYFSKNLITASILTFGETAETQDSARNIRSIGITISLAQSEAALTAPVRNAL